MTSINKLTKNSIVNPGDLLVIWDKENKRTRSISYDTLKAAVPYLESAEYISPNLILKQSDGETITVAIPSGGDVISGLLDGQVPVKDQATGQLVYSGATVNPDTGQWVFDRTIEVPSSSLDVGDVVTISEGSTDLLISNNIDGIVSAVVSSQIDSTGAKPPSYFKLGPEKSFIPQPFDGQVITTNPLIASSTGRVVAPDVRQINQTIFRADQDMPNVVAEIKDKASGMVIKYIPSRAAWEAETEEDRARNPGLNFIAGDNVIDYVSREEDTPGVFNIGVSPFRLIEGQEFEIIIKADVMALKGTSGVPYLAEMVQDGPEVFLLSEDDQYIDEIIAGNNVVVDSSNPKKPVVSASGGSGGAGVTIDVDDVEITTGVDTLNFDSNSIQLTDNGANKVTIAAKVQPTNYVGIFETVAQLQAAYPSPDDGLYADIINESNNKPPSRYESQSDAWVGLGGIPGDVIVNDIKSLGIVAGEGLKYEDDGGSAKLSVSGNIPVTTFDVTTDSTRNVDPSYVGGVISIIQTPPAISIPMQIYISDHSAFEVGDVIKIGADRDGENAYTNYYFAAYYNDASGQNLVRYPANNITMIRTLSSWDVQLDGRFTNVSIRPRSEFNAPYEADEQYSTPVNAFVFAESDAVEFDVDEDSNTRIVKIDLDAINPDNPTFKTVSLDTSGSGQPNFTTLIKQDNELHTVIDATRELRVNYKDIGTGSTTTVFGVDNTQAQFLVPIMQGNDAVALAKDIPSIPEDIEMRFGVNEFYDNGPDSEYIQDNPIQFLEMECNGGYINQVTHQNYGYTTYIRVYAGNNTSKGVEIKDSTGRVSGRKTLRIGELWRVTSAQKDTTADVFWERVDDGTSPSDVYDGEFGSVSVAYNGLYGDDNRLFYPATVTQDNNGWTQEEFTSTKVIRSKNATTGVVGDKVLELTPSRVTHRKQPFFNDDRLATRTNNHIANTASFNDLIYTSGQNVNEWIADNQDYTPAELLDVIFECKVLGQTNWICSATTSGNNYNETFPTSYQQVEIHKTGGSARSFMRAYNKESHTHYFSPYKTGEDPSWQTYAYLDDVDNKIAEDKAKGVWIGGVIKDTVNDDGNPGDQLDCGNPKHWVEFRKTSIGADQYLVRQRSSVTSSEIVIHLHVESGMTSCKFRVQTGAGQYRDKTIRVNEKWRFFLMQGVYPYFERIEDGSSSYVQEEDFNSKSGYNKLSSGGGSTHRIEFWENGTIFKLSNSKIEVRLLEGMQDEDGKRHGYVKYINSRGSDVNFEWYDRNGNQIINSTVPSVCPADTVVEIFANYSTDDYAINFSQSKVISSSIAEAQAPSFSKFINKSTVTVDYPLDANGDQYRPINVAVMVLDTDNLISDLNITVTSSDSYDGNYNSIGVIAIDSNGEWTTHSRRNGYRLNDGTNTYCVYSDSLNSWVLLAASVDHNHIGSIAGGVPINLYNDGQLPESYGNYSLDNNLDSIESEYFTKADVDIDYHTNSGANSYFTVDFGSAKPAGIIFYK